MKPRSNKVFARHEFHLRVQQAGESFEQFLTELKLLVKDCGHADPDEMVRDRVVIGCYSSKAREKLIHEGSDLKLEKAIDVARTEEISQAQLQTMATENPSINSVKTKKQKTPVEKKFGKDCGRCGYQHDQGKCPAQGKKCSKCHKLKHFASCCLSKNPDKKGVNCVDECSDDEFFIGCITSVNSVDTSEWCEDLKVHMTPNFFPLFFIV